MTKGAFLIEGRRRRGIVRDRIDELEEKARRVSRGIRVAILILAYSCEVSFANTDVIDIRGERSPSPNERTTQKAFSSGGWELFSKDPDIVLLPSYNFDYWSVHRASSLPTLSSIERISKTQKAQQL